MENVAAVMSVLKRRWYELSLEVGDSLAGHLGVPWSKWHEIRQNHPQQVSLASYCVTFLPGFSWSTLAGALHYCEEDAALQAARRYIKREEGKLCAVMKLYSGTFVKW